MISWIFCLKKTCALAKTMREISEFKGQGLLGNCPAQRGGFKYLITQALERIKGSR